MEPQRSLNADMAMATGVAHRPVATDSPSPLSLPRVFAEPLRIGNTELPESVLLMAKVLTLAFLATGQVRLLSWHFLPFFRIFDRLGSPAVFHWTLVALFLTASACLFYNRRVRLCCLVLGGVILVSAVSSRTYFENNRVYCACILLLAGFSARGQKPWPLRLQVALVYFGAALNKLLQADWRSGQFFAYWFGQIHHPQLWAYVTRVVPAVSLAQLACWATILTEFILVAGFLVPRWYRRAIWLGVAYHTTLLLVMNSTFGMFYYAMLASYLAFIDWPRPQLKVVYQDDLGYVARLLQLLERLDADRLFEWGPFSIAHEREARRASPYKILFVLDHEQIWRGLAALKRIMLLTPAAYFFAVILLARQPHFFPYLRWLAAMVFLFFTPFPGFISERVYRWAIHHGESPVARPSTSRMRDVSRSSNAA